MVSVDVEGKIAIPAALSGVILGRGGATIKAIAEESSTSLVMDGKDQGSEATQERVLSVVGTAAGCMNCTSLVLAKLIEASPEGRFEYSQKGTTYPKSVLSYFGSVVSGSSPGSLGDRSRARTGGGSRGAASGLGGGKLKGDGEILSEFYVI